MVSTPTGLKRAEMMVSAVMVCFVPTRAAPFMYTFSFRNPSSGVAMMVIDEPCSTRSPLFIAVEPRFAVRVPFSDVWIVTTYLIFLKVAAIVTALSIVILLFTISMSLAVNLSSS